MHVCVGSGRPFSSDDVVAAESLASLIDDISLTLSNEFSRSERQLLCVCIYIYIYVAASVSFMFVLRYLM